MKRIRVTWLVAYLMMYGAQSHGAEITVLWNNEPTVLVGDIFSLDVVGIYTDPGVVTGGAISFGFDPSVVQVNSVTVNPDIADFDSSAGTIDNNVGEVTGIGFATFSGASGTFSIATVEFSALAIGMSTLLTSAPDIFPYFWANDQLADNFTVNPVVNNGSVTIVTVPAAFWLFFSALGTLAGLVRKQTLERKRTLYQGA